MAQLTFGSRTKSRSRRGQQRLHLVAAPLPADSRTRSWSASSACARRSAKASSSVERCAELLQRLRTARSRTWGAGRGRGGAEQASASAPSRDGGLRCRPGERRGLLDEQGRTCAGPLADELVPQAHERHHRAVPHRLGHPAAHAAEHALDRGRRVGAPRPGCARAASRRAPRPAGGCAAPSGTRPFGG
jgi:hypothetical protein